MASQKYLRELTEYAKRAIAAFNYGPNDLEHIDPAGIRVRGTGVEVVWYEALPRQNKPGWVVQERKRDHARPEVLWFMTSGTNTVGAAKHLGIALSQRMIEAHLDGVKSRGNRKGSRR